MRLFLFLVLIAPGVFAQGLPGATTVIVPVERDAIYAHLFRPAGKKPDPKRHAAMVIVHGYGGVSDAREGFWARELAALGVAALVIESFTARGAGSSIEDQSRISTARGLRDAHAAAAWLAVQDFVDPKRIGVMGMSWGGSVAMRAADRRRKGGFAIAIPIYPGCVAQYRTPQPGVPMLLLLAGLDDYAGTKTCVDYALRIGAAGGAVELRIYGDAHHGFDAEGASFSAEAPSFRDCVLYIEDDGSTTYARTGEPLESPEKAFDLMKRDCMRTGATLAGNARARQEALNDVKAFLKTTLLR